MERISRLCAVTFLVVGGLVHLQLWRTGYRGIPKVGDAFLVSIGLAFVLALAVLVRNDWRLNLAGILFATGSLGAIVMSRTVGILGFTERAWTDRAVQATTAEIGAIVALAAVLLLTRRRVALATVRT
ncbi:MAG: hypothetical protein ACR2MO_16290 [Acidimicrobiales bacterium]